jgi:hypothetical protein
MLIDNHLTIPDPIGHLIPNRRISGEPPPNPNSRGFEAHTHQNLGAGGQLGGDYTDNRRKISTTIAPSR